VAKRLVQKKQKNGQQLFSNRFYLQIQQEALFFNKLPKSEEKKVRRNAAIHRDNWNPGSEMFLD